jgi:hypothetical protein
MQELIPNVASNFVSIEWTGFLLPQFSEEYRFEAKFNDGLRLWVNDILIIDYFVDAANDLNGHTIESEKILLIANVFVPIKV